MKIRILLVIFLMTTFFWSCDEPQPVSDSNFVYNPFSFKQDTLHTITSMTSGSNDILWNDHLGAWVGGNEFYKAGLSVDFTFADSSFDIITADSIRFEIQHVFSFASDPADSIACFDFYETTGQTIDLSTSNYGISLGCDSLNTDGGNNLWAFTLPEGTIVEGDSSISLGVFRDESSVLSLVHGGGSPSRPVLKFYYHESDTAGNDSIYYNTITADTLFMHLMERSLAFDHDQYEYISQFAQDSIVFSIDLSRVIPEGDTLVHISVAQFLPAIDTLASRIYIPTADDTSSIFYMSVSDPVSELRVDLKLGDGARYLSNQIDIIIQAALDDGRSTMNLILRPNHIGYDPGFVAISKDLYETTLLINSSLAIRP